MAAPTFDRLFDKPPAPALPEWALELARQAVVLQQTQKHSMLTVRFDGQSWQIFVAAPVVKLKAG